MANIVLNLVGCKTPSPFGKPVALDESGKPLPEVVDFTFDVKPLPSNRRFKCHGPDKNAIEGGLSSHRPEDAYKALVEKSTIIHAFQAILRKVCW